MCCLLQDLRHTQVPLNIRYGFLLSFIELYILFKVLMAEEVTVCNCFNRLISQYEGMGLTENKPSTFLFVSNRFLVSLWSYNVHCTRTPYVHRQL